MRHGDGFDFGRAFETLTQRERLFLYLTRNWARSQSAAGSKLMLKPAVKRCDIALDTFLRSFAQALPEPLMVKPQRCRCSIQFHEATLLDLFSSVSKGDTRALNRALEDMIPSDTIERLASYITPVIHEVDVALETIA